MRIQRFFAFGTKGLRALVLAIAPIAVAAASVASCDRGEPTQDETTAKTEQALDPPSTCVDGGIEDRPEPRDPSAGEIPSDNSEYASPR